MMEIQNEITMVYNDLNQRNRYSEILKKIDAKTSFSLMSDVKGFNRLPPSPVLLIQATYADTLRYCELIRKNLDYHLTILIAVSDRLTTVEKCALFDAGMDDYFDLTLAEDEIISRFNSQLMRRSRFSSASTQLSFGQFRFDLLKQSVHIIEKSDEIDLRLTPIEFKIFHFLATHSGSKFKANQIMEMILPKANIYSKSAHAHLYAIRKKLKNYKNVITNEPRQGYYLRADFTLAK